jgi:hypothetical protein
MMMTMMTMMTTKVKVKAKTSSDFSIKI